MSRVFTEPRHAGEFILSEASGNRSREGVKIGENQNIEPGTLLAILALTAGDYHAVVFNPESDDGSEKASAIAIYPAKTGAGETLDIAAIFRDAEANGKCLAWPEGITAEQQAAAIADLASVGIIVR